MSFFQAMLGAGGATLIGVESFNDIYVPNGTAFGSINFSDYSLDQASAINSNSEFITVGVNWQQGSYDGNTSANYTLTGTITGISNPLGITASITVHVVTLTTEYQTLLNRGTTLGYTLPTPICQGADNQLMTTIKTLALDVFHCYETDGSKEFATLNWMAPTTNQATLVNTPTFTRRIGFTGNGTSSYINTNFNPSTATNFTQNEAGFGVYSPKSGLNGTILGLVATGARLTLAWSNTTFSNVFEINGNTNSQPVNPTPFGFYHAIRIVSTAVTLYLNSAFIAQGTSDVSVARPNGNVYLCARNNSGTPDQFSSSTVGCFFAGASLNTSRDTLYNAWAARHSTIRQKVQYSNPSQIGSILNDSFARALLGSSYATTGGTWSLDGAKMTVSGGASTPNQRLLYKYGHSSEKYIISTIAKITSTIGAGSTGIGLGCSDYSGLNGQRTVYCQLDLSTGSNAGKIIIYTYDGTTNAQVAISSAIPSITQNNQFIITFQKEIVNGSFQYTATAIRISDNTTVSSVYTNLIGESTGDFSMFNFGGTIEVTNLSITINDNKNERICFVGNSLTHGVMSTSLNLRYAALAYPPSYSISGGSGDLTEDVIGSSSTIIGKINNIIDYNARYYFLIIGGNDIAGSISSSVWQNNLKRITNALISEGYKVIFASPFARSTGNMGEYYNFTSVQWPNNISINQTFTDTKNAGNNQLKAAYDSGDGIHLNDAGHAVGANAVSVNLPILY